MRLKPLFIVEEVDLSAYDPTKALERGEFRTEEIILDDGKYRFYTDERVVQCDRYGEGRRDFCGDKAVSSLFSKCLTVMSCLQELVDIIDNSPEDIDSFTTQPARTALEIKS